MNDYDDPLAMPWLHIKPKVTTPDPTTRDPAASLRACIELAAKASPGPWTTGDGDPESILSERDYTCIAQANTSFVDRAPANAAAIAAAVNFIRDAAPALLAEVGELTERADRFHARAESYRKDAESLERALAGAVALLRAVIPVLEPGELNADVIRGCIETFLAHHGAGTGESNER